MSHSFVSCALHCVFSTKMRQPDLTAELRERLFPYLIASAHSQGIHILAVGGVEDHLHVLLSLSADMSVSRTMHLIKGPTSRWIHETFPRLPHFAWQQGYSAFSVGVSQRARTVEYIHNQMQHHQKKTFEQELRAFYTRHGFKWETSVLDRIYTPSGVE